MFAKCMVVSLLLSSPSNPVPSNKCRWTAWLLLTQELALHVARATDDSTIFIVLLLFAFSWWKKGNKFLHENSLVNWYNFVTFLGILQEKNVGHLIHFGGALCALLFLPFIIFCSPTDSAMRRIISTQVLPSKRILAVELAAAACVFVVLVASFLFIEHLDPFPEIGLSKSLSHLDFDVAALVRLHVL
jgi:hypothetical protein